MIIKVFLEIRAGTGGDESALFAGDLFKMYSKFSEERKWKVKLFHRACPILVDSRR